MSQLGIPTAGAIEKRPPLFHGMFQGGVEQFLCLTPTIRPQLRAPYFSWILLQTDKWQTRMRVGFIELR
jgi:hypothetical protein